jgi:hypothetical protein
MLDARSREAVPHSSFAFGEIHLRFESVSRTWLSYLDRRYGRFAEPSREDSFVVRFEPTSGSMPHGLVTPLAAHLESVRCEPVESGYRVRTDTSGCDIDLQSGRATLWGPPAMYPLDNVLRHLLPLLCESGLLVHSALVTDSDGRGILASGPSGAGKSTIARLARGRALADELAAVDLMEAAPTAVALPFWESRPGRARLRAILHIGHGNRHRVKALRPEEALRRLSGEVLWPVWSEAAMARSFSFLADMTETVPAYDLEFSPASDVWEFVEKEIS